MKASSFGKTPKEYGTTIWEWIQNRLDRKWIVTCVAAVVEGAQAEARATGLEDAARIAEKAHGDIGKDIARAIRARYGVR